MDFSFYWFTVLYIRYYLKHDKTCRPYGALKHLSDTLYQNVVLTGLNLIENPNLSGHKLILQRFDMRNHIIR